MYVYWCAFKMTHFTSSFIGEKGTGYTGYQYQKEPCISLSLQNNTYGLIIKECVDVMKRVDIVPITHFQN